MKFTFHKDEATSLYQILVDNRPHPKLMNLQPSTPEGNAFMMQRLQEAFPDRMFVVTCDTFGGETYWLIVGTRISPKGQS